MDFAVALNSLLGIPQTGLKWFWKFLETLKITEVIHQDPAAFIFQAISYHIYIKQSRKQYDINTL